MSALKPKKFSSDEEQQEKIQYVVVQHSSQIKKILKAEKETPIIQTSKEPTPVNSTEQKPKTQEKAIKTRQFIKDDRHREYPKFKDEEKRQTKFQQKYQPKKENNKYQKTEKEQQSRKEAPKRRNQRYQSREHAHQSQKEQKKQNNKEGKLKYVQKSQLSNYKDEKDSEKRQKANNKNGSYNQKQKTTVRQQYQYINGEQITIQLIQNRREHDNVIFIGEKLAKDYVKLAKKLISQEDTIIIKAFGLFVSKAFLVAGLLADETPGLKQINNPSTVSVLQFSKKSKTKTKRAMIEIELSLNSLNKKNFGYQEAQPLQPKQTESKSNKGRDRPQERRAFKQKEEIDERQLR